MPYLFVAHRASPEVASECHMTFALNEVAIPITARVRKEE